MEEVRIAPLLLLREEEEEEEARTLFWRAAEGEANAAALRGMLVVPRAAI